MRKLNLDILKKHALLIISSISAFSITLFYLLLREQKDDGDYAKPMLRQIKENAPQIFMHQNERKHFYRRNEDDEKNKKEAIEINSSEKVFLNPDIQKVNINKYYRSNGKVIKAKRKQLWEERKKLKGIVNQIFGESVKK